MTKSFMEGNWATTKCVIDANVVIATFLPNHPLHSVTLSLWQIFSSPKYLNPLIVSEVATILLKLTKKIDLASETTHRLINNQLTDIYTTPLTQKLLYLTQKIFASQRAPKLSFADCSLIAQAKLSKINTILTFDQDLRKSFPNQFTFLPEKLQ